MPSALVFESRRIRAEARVARYKDLVASHDMNMALNMAREQLAHARNLIVLLQQTPPAARSR